MVLDHINNFQFYTSQHPLFSDAFQFLKGIKESDFENSKVEINGDKCFALFFKGEGKGSDKIVMEAHKRYLDIQFIFKGSDLMGFKPLHQCKNVNTPYIEKDDYVLFDETPDTNFLVKENNFTIFYPADGHAPLLGKESVWKVVVKVLIN